MTFEETKNTLIENRELLKDLYPTLNIWSLLKTSFELIERALNKDLSEVSQEEKDEMNCLLRMTINTVIESETSQEEIQLLIIILDLFQNLESAYPGLFNESWNLRILSTLIGSKRSLEDAILLCTYLSKRIKGVFSEEDSTSFLSRKFYEEYNYFLKRKTHDDSYSLNNKD